MEKNITELDVQKAKNSIRTLLKKDDLDLSYITIELLSKPAVRIENESLQTSYYGNNWFNTSDGQTGEQLIGFHSDNNGQNPCGEILKYIPGNLYNIYPISNCIGTNFQNYHFVHK